MTEAIWIAIIGSFQVVLVALISKISRDTRRAKNAAEAAEEQVANSHTLPSGETYNLRDNIDHNQSAVMAELRGVRRDIGRLDTRDIERGREIRDLTHKVDKHLEWSAAWSDEREAADRDAAKRIGDIEDTLNPAKDKS